MYTARYFVCILLAGTIGIATMDLPHGSMRVAGGILALVIFICAFLPARDKS